MEIKANVTTNPITVQTNVKTLKTLRVGLNVKVSGGEGLPTYDGDYIVVPSVWQEQSIPTKNKKLIDNVTVTKVPYAEVSNEAGGKTITIGEALMMCGMSLAIKD